MYKEEKIINGILHYRTSPNAEFKPYTLEGFTGIVGMLKEEMQKQQEVNIEGKDPITIEGKDPLTIDFTNPKGGAKLTVDSSRINFGYESMQGTLEEVAERLYPDCSNVLRQMAKETFIKGAKWQQERMYSEEEVIQLVSDWTDYRMSEDTKSKITFKKWFEQFKINRK